MSSKVEAQKYIIDNIKLIYGEDIPHYDINQPHQLLQVAVDAVAKLKETNKEVTEEVAKSDIPVKETVAETVETVEETVETVEDKTELQEVEFSYERQKNGKQGKKTPRNKS